jgi:hypothetical protein
MAKEDQIALDSLRVLAQAADGKQLDALLPADVTKIDVGAVYRFIEADQRAAAAAIALVVVSAAAAGPGRDQSLRAHLGLLFVFYVAIYPRRSHFNEAVERCVPDIHALVRETERTFRKQHG